MDKKQEVGYNVFFFTRFCFGYFCVGLRTILIRELHNPKHGLVYVERYYTIQSAYGTIRNALGELREAVRSSS